MGSYSVEHDEIVRCLSVDCVFSLFFCEWNDDFLFSCHAMMYERLQFELSVSLDDSQQLSFFRGLFTE
jgi:hypothetical protein